MLTIERRSNILLLTLNRAEKRNSLHPERRCPEIPQKRKPGSSPGFSCRFQCHASFILVSAFNS